MPSVNVVNGKQIVVEDLVAMMQHADETNEEGECFWCAMDSRDDGWYHAADCAADVALRAYAALRPQREQVVRAVPRATAS